MLRVKTRNGLGLTYNLVLLCVCVFAGSATFCEVGGYSLCAMFAQAFWKNVSQKGAV